MSSPNYRNSFNNNIPSNIRSGIHGIEGGIWSPKVFSSSLQFWCRSDQGITFGASGIRQWDDLSGQENHLIQLTASVQPRYNSIQTPNGRPLISFDGYSGTAAPGMNLKTIRSFTLPQPFTLYMSGIHRHNTVKNGIIFDGYTANTTYIINHTTNVISVRAATPALTILSPIYDSISLLKCVFNTTNSSIRLNNLTQYTGNIGTNAANGFVIGGASGYYSKMDIAEIVVVNRVLTSDEETSLSSYMTNWSGISV